MQGLPIPESWISALAEIQVYFPQAVIAGGALRDFFHAKPIKDIDVFIPVRESDVNVWDDTIEKLDPYYRTVCTKVYGQENSTLPGFRYLYAIYQIQKFKMPLIEIIFIKAEERDAYVSDAFDINICQIEHNGKDVRFTKDFLSGVASQQLWVCNYNRTDRQARRLARMQEKYPEYTVRAQDPEMPVNPLFDLYAD